MYTISSLGSSMPVKDKDIGVGIVGGTGYGAGELLRWCVAHPNLSVASVVSESQAGSAICGAHPHLKGFYNGTFDRELRWDLLEKQHQRFVIVALPHGRSGAVARNIVESAPIANVRVIDLSGDLRLRSDVQHKLFYGAADIPDAFRHEAVYGLPEINRAAIRTARVVANPGCLASTAILALHPICNTGLVESVKIAACTGSSGGGKKLTDTVHHAVRHANYSAYKVLEHQHEPEIAQACGISDCAFVTHRAPWSRGIFVTSFLTLREEISAERMRTIYRAAYNDSPFIRLVDTESPELENVVGSNFCDIAFCVRNRLLVVLSAADNLVKGMTGTALQNLNIMSGLSETTGLWTPAARPL